MIERTVWSNDFTYCYDPESSEEGAFFWLTEEQALCLHHALSLFNTHVPSIELKNRLEEIIVAIREDRKNA